MLTGRLLVGGLVALYVGLGALLLWHRRRLRREVAESRAWPSTASTVLRSELHERTSRAGREYIPVVAYEYRVDGQTYRSSRLHFGETIAYSVKRRAERRRVTLTANATDRVFYDPGSPARAVVERSAPVLRRDAVLMAVATAVFVGGLVALLAELA